MAKNLRFSRKYTKSTYTECQKSAKFVICLKNHPKMMGKNLRKSIIVGQIGAKISENPTFWFKFSKKTKKYNTMEPLKKSKSNPRSANVSKSPNNDCQKSKIFQ